MIDLTRVRLRWGANPHYLNVDYGSTEVGYLVLSGYGEVVEAVVHREEDDHHRQIVGETRRLAESMAGAVASCVSPRQ